MWLAFMVKAIVCLPLLTDFNSYYKEPCIHGALGLLYNPQTRLQNMVGLLTSAPSLSGVAC